MLNLTGLNLVSHSRNNEFWGNSLRFAIRDNYSFQGKLLDLQNYSGAAGILTQLSGQNKAAVDYDSLVVNGLFLGNARISTLSYSEGVDVRLSDYQINATVFTSGNTSNLNFADPIYSGINLSSQQFPAYLVENLTEDFESEVAEDGTYSESQRIQLKFASGAAIGTVQNPVSMAQLFAANLAGSNPPVGFINSFYSGWRQKPGRRLNTESINLVTNEISLNQNFKVLRDISGSYALNYTNSLQIDEAGICNIREQGKVQGLTPDIYGNFYAAALSGEQYEVTNNSFNRCSDVFNNYAPVSSYPLNTARLIYGQTLNKFTDTVSYEVSYSNNPKVNSLYSWEYTQSAEREKTECTYKITEDGTVQGYPTNCSPATKYANAVFVISGIKTGIYLRSYNFYTGFSQFANPIKLIEQSDSRDKIRGIIKYSQTFTDNLIYSYSGIKKMVVSIQDDFSVPGKNIFNIVNVKQIAQPNNLVSLSKRNLNVEMLGFRGTDLTGYQNLAIQQINANVPTGTDPYIAELNYSFAPRNNQFGLACSWISYDSGISQTSFLL